MNRRCGNEPPGWLLLALLFLLFLLTGPVMTQGNDEQIEAERSPLEGGDVSPLKNSDRSLTNSKSISFFDTDVPHPRQASESKFYPARSALGGSWDTPSKRQSFSREGILSLLAKGSLHEQHHRSQEPLRKPLPSSQLLALLDKYYQLSGKEPQHQKETVITSPDSFDLYEQLLREKLHSNYDIKSVQRPSNDNNVLSLLTKIENLNNERSKLPHAIMSHIGQSQNKEGDIGSSFKGNTKKLNEENTAPLSYGEIYLHILSELYKDNSKVIKEDDTQNETPTLPYINDIQSSNDVKSVATSTSPPSASTVTGVNGYEDLSSYAPFYPTISPVPAGISYTNIQNCLKGTWCALLIAAGVGVGATAAIAVPFVIPAVLGRRRRNLEYFVISRDNALSVINHYQRYEDNDTLGLSDTEKIFFDSLNEAESESSAMYHAFKNFLLAKENVLLNITIHEVEKENHIVIPQDIIKRIGNTDMDDNTISNSFTIEDTIMNREGVDNLHNKEQGNQEQQQMVYNQILEDVKSHNAEQEQSQESQLILKQEGQEKRLEQQEQEYQEEGQHGHQIANLQQMRHQVLDPIQQEDHNDNKNFPDEQQLLQDSNIGYDESSVHNISEAPTDKPDSGHLSMDFDNECEPENTAGTLVSQNPSEDQFKSHNPLLDLLPSSVYPSSILDFRIDEQPISVPFPSTGSRPSPLQIPIPLGSNPGSGGSDVSIVIDGDSAQFHSDNFHEASGSNSFHGQDDLHVNDRFQNEDYYLGNSNSEFQFHAEDSPSSENLFQEDAMFFNTGIMGSQGAPVEFLGAFPSVTNNPDGFYKVGDERPYSQQYYFSNNQNQYPVLWSSGPQDIPFATPQATSFGIMDRYPTLKQLQQQGYQPGSESQFNYFSRHPNPLQHFNSNGPTSPYQHYYQNYQPFNPTVPAHLQHWNFQRYQYQPQQPNVHNFEQQPYHQTSQPNPLGIRHHLHNQAYQLHGLEIPLEHRQEHKPFQTSLPEHIHQNKYQSSSQPSSLFLVKPPKEETPQLRPETVTFFQTVCSVVGSGDIPDNEITRFIGDHCAILRYSGTI